MVVRKRPSTFSALCAHGPTTVRQPMLIPVVMARFRLKIGLPVPAQRLPDIPAHKTVCNHRDPGERWGVMWM